MASVCNNLHPISASTLSQIHLSSVKPSKYACLRLTLQLPNIHLRRLHVRCSKLTPWEPTPVTYAPVDEADDVDIFATREADEIETALMSSTPKPKENGKNPPPISPTFFKWPLWVLGPFLLLTTGMVPTLWLPLSSIFLGPTIASLLSLVGLDCIFNLGATLFLLMAHSCAKPKDLSQPYKSTPPLTYRFCNTAASIAGFAVPLAMLFGSHRGYLQPQLPYISFLLLLGPYLLLLMVQLLTEQLMWHWQSPAWLVAPLVYEAYRVLQLMRSLKLGVELGAADWMVHALRGLVCWWVLILGVQLMRVAWFAGFSAKARGKKGNENPLAS